MLFDCNVNVLPPTILAKLQYRISLEVEYFTAANIPGFCSTGFFFDWNESFVFYSPFLTFLFKL